MSFSQASASSACSALIVVCYRKPSTTALSASRKRAISLMVL
jgi:hypothetical protein